MEAETKENKIPAIWKVRFAEGIPRYFASPGPLLEFRGFPASQGGAAKSGILGCARTPYRIWSEHPHHSFLLCYLLLLDDTRRRICWKEFVGNPRRALLALRIVTLETLPGGPGPSILRAVQRTLVCRCTWRSLLSESRRDFKMLQERCIIIVSWVLKNSVGHQLLRIETWVSPVTHTCSSASHQACSSSSNYFSDLFPHQHCLC